MITGQTRCPRGERVRFARLHRCNVTVCQRGKQAGEPIKLLFSRRLVNSVKEKYTVTGLVVAR